MDTATAMAMKQAQAKKAAIPTVSEVTPPVVEVSLQDIKLTLAEVEKLYQNANTLLPAEKRLDDMLKTAVFTFAPDKPFGSKGGVFLRSWVRAGKAAPWRQKDAQGKIIVRPEFNTNPSTLAKGMRATAHAVLQNVAVIWAYVYADVEASQQGRYHSQEFARVYATLGLDSQKDTYSNSGYVLAENTKAITAMCQDIDSEQFNLWREQDRNATRMATGIYSTWSCPANCPPPGVPAGYDGGTIRMQFRAPKDYPTMAPGIRCHKCGKTFTKVDKGKKVNAAHKVEIVGAGKV